MLLKGEMAQTTNVLNHEAVIHLTGSNIDRQIKHSRFPVATFEEVESPKNGCEVEFTVPTMQSSFTYSKQNLEVEEEIMGVKGKEISWTLDHMHMLLLFQQSKKQILLLCCCTYKGTLVF